MSDTHKAETCPTCGWDRGIPETEECDGEAVCPTCKRMRNVYHADEGTSGFVPPPDARHLPHLWERRQGEPIALEGLEPRLER